MLLNYGGMERRRRRRGSLPDAEPPQPRHLPPRRLNRLPAAPADSDFCSNVAAQDATRNGFDQATQTARAASKAMRSAMSRSYTR